MRYYTYISDAKLDQLFGQLPRKWAARISGELNLDLKVASVSVQDTKPDPTRFDRLRLVERHIDENCDVGWWTEQRPWFRGEMGLRTGYFGDRSAVLYTGLEQDTVIAMIGSGHHLLDRASARDETQLQSRTSDVAALLALLERQGEDYRAPEYLPRRTTDEQMALDEVTHFVQQMVGPRQSCEFLARRLLGGTTTGPDGRTVSVVVGTPLYVALSDE